MRDKNNKIFLKIFNFNEKRLEKMLIISFIFCVLLLITAQFLMTDPNIRAVLTQEEDAEGVFLDQADSIYDKGVVIIELADGISARNNAYVLVNGQKAAEFTQSQVSISVKDGDLIEIDGTQEGNPFTAKVSSYSSNMKLTVDNSILEVDKNIGVLARVKFK